MQERVLVDEYLDTCMSVGSYVRVRERAHFEVRICARIVPACAYEGVQPRRFANVEQVGSFYSVCCTTLYFRTDSAQTLL